MENVSLWYFFSNASILVKFIMLSLIVLSVFSWSFIIQRYRALSQIDKQIKQFENQFWSGADLNKLYESVDNKRQSLIGTASIFSAGYKEYLRLRQNKVTNPGALIDGTARAMNIATSKEASKLQDKLSFLATVGSVSPFIGLFGTVWGIMHSFIALHDVQQATLSMVAPGIAEALVATAMGLFAAIPAVIAYNRFNSHIEKLSDAYETFQDEFTNILHRQTYANS